MVFKEQIIFFHWPTAARAIHSKIRHIRIISSQLFRFDQWTKIVHSNDHSQSTNNRCSQNIKSHRNCCAFSNRTDILFVFCFDTNLFTFHNFFEFSFYSGYRHVRHFVCLYTYVDNSYSEKKQLCFSFGVSWWCCCCCCRLLVNFFLCGSTTCTENNDFLLLREVQQTICFGLACQNMVTYKILNRWIMCNRCVSSITFRYFVIGKSETRILLRFQFFRRFFLFVTWCFSLNMYYKWNDKTITWAQQWEYYCIQWQRTQCHSKRKWYHFLK